MFDEFNEYQLHKAGLCTGACYYCQEEDEALEQISKQAKMGNRYEDTFSWER